MKLCAVIDTNVLVSALLKWDSVPGAVLEQSLVGSLIPVLSGPILSEYSEVLHRKKFPFQEEDIRILIHRFYRRGIFLEPLAPPEDLPDPKDAAFYAVTMEARQNGDAYLVTGNIKHFPLRPFIVTPREMLTRLERLRQTDSAENRGCVFYFGRRS